MNRRIVFLGEFVHMPACWEGESETSSDLVHTLSGTVVDCATHFLYFIQGIPEKEIIVSARSREDYHWKF